MSDEVDAPSRRAVLTTGAAAVLAVALAPRMALADVAATEAELKRLFGDRPMNESKITLDVPQIAENGLAAASTARARVCRARSSTASSPGSTARRCSARPGIPRFPQPLPVLLPQGDRERPSSNSHGRMMTAPNITARPS